MTLRVVIDRNVCSGTSNCAEEAPEAFAVDERGLAVLLPGAHDDDALLRAARACPVDAIRVYDATGEQIHP